MTDAELRRRAEAAIDEAAMSMRMHDGYKRDDWFPAACLSEPGTFVYEEAAYIAAVSPHTILALLDRIDAVRALHVPRDWDPIHCQHCGFTYPCPTVRALDGEP